jgi:CHAT domain-containing protein
MRMGIASKLLLLIAGLAVLTTPGTALAQFGSRLRQMAAPPQNAGGTQYAFYEGDLHFEKGIDPVCTALTNGVYKVYFAARSGPGGVEAFMFGEKILHAYIKGSDRNHLSVTYLGDSAPSRSMRLTPLGNGFLGLVQSKTLVSEIYGACTTSNAEFKVSRSNADGQAAFQTYAQQFQLDVSSEQDLLAARRGRINEALPRLRQAFALKTKQYSPNHPQMLRYYFYLASAYDEAGLYPSAAYWYQKAVAVCQQSFAANDACGPITLLKLGQSLQANGNTRDAEPNIRQAIQASNQVFGPNAPVSWRGYASLALGLIFTGRFAEVEPVLKQALALARQDHNPDINVATVKYVAAMLDRQTGQYKLAEDTLRESIALVQKVQGKDGSGIIFPGVALAGIMSLSGQSAAAEPIAKAALEAEQTQLGPERPDHPLLSSVRVALATIEMELGKNREAEELLRRALESDKKYLGPNHPAVAVDAMTLAKLLRTTGREQEASSLLQQAYGIAHMTEIQGIRWRVPAEYMQLYASGKLANRTLAIYYGKEAVNDLQRLRSDMSRSSSGTLESFSNAAEVKSIYKTLAHLLLEDGRVPEAEQVLALLSVQEMDQFSSRSLLADADPAQNPKPNAMASAPRGAANNADAGTRGLGRMAAPELSFSQSEQDLHQVSGKEIEVGEELEQLKQKKFDQGDDFSATDEKTLEALQKQYDGYTNNFFAAEAKMAKKSKDGQHVSDEINNFSTAFQGTLKSVGHGAVAAQYFMFDDGVDIILATPNGAPIHRFHAIKLATMKQMIRDFRRKVGDAHQDPSALSRQLYDVLIGPIAGDLQQANAKTLMLSLHDGLRYVPFAALNSGKGYLIESMAVVNINPTAMDKLAVEPKPEPWSAYGLGVTKGGRTKSGVNYEALTYAGEELDDVKNTLGGKSKISKDEQFTKSNLQSGLGFYPVIHIASHFEFTPGSIDDSMLLLGDGSTLSLSEIRGGLNFTNVELLTLSACQTAVGDDRSGADGSEVEGLGKIAQEKGAMAVIATLWPVADESTALFMNALYKAHQVDHKDKAESLRQAQLTLLHTSAQDASQSGGLQRGLGRMPAAAAAGGPPGDSNAPFAHPYYWAPFILMGNWL